MKRAALEEVQHYVAAHYIWQSIAPTEGMSVEKVGQATGWTTGTVTDTCADELDGTSLTKLLLCQGYSDLYAAGGDSGAPIFYWWWFYGVDTVELVGLLWGEDNDGYGRKFFSPWANVNLDLRGPGGPDLYIRYPYF